MLENCVNGYLFVESLNFSHQIIVLVHWFEVLIDCIE